MFADRLGCENLLNDLATVHNLKIYLNRTRRILLPILGNGQQFCADSAQADILVLEEQQPHKLETFKTAFGNKNINVRLITTEREVKPIGVKWLDDVRHRFAIENGIIHVRAFNWSFHSHQIDGNNFIADSICAASHC